MTLYLADLGIINALGTGKTAVLNGLLQEDQSGMLPTGPLLTGRESLVGTVTGPLDELPAEFSEFDCRNNRLLVAAVSQIEEPIRRLRSEYGSERVAVLIGTSTSGIAAGEEAMDAHKSQGERAGNVADGPVVDGQGEPGRYGHRPSRRTSGGVLGVRLSK